MGRANLARIGKLNQGFQRVTEPCGIVLQQRERVDFSHVAYRPNDHVVVAGLGHRSTYCLAISKHLSATSFIFELSGSESNIVRDAVSEHASIRAPSSID